MEALKKEKAYTIDDIYALPDGERAELMDGQIYYMAPPGRTHQKFVSELHYQIKDYIKKNNGSCEIFPAPFAVFLDGDDSSYVEPDLTVICDASKLDEKGCHGAPDWVIEVVSPSSRSRDYIKKMIKYGTAGVREYWIVDTQKQVVTVYDFENERMEQYMPGQEIPAGIFQGLSIHVL